MYVQNALLYLIYLFSGYFRAAHHLKVGYIFVSDLLDIILVVKKWKPNRQIEILEDLVDCQVWHWLFIH